MNNIETAVDCFKGGFNCSQAILSTYCESLGLDREAALRLASGFGGGMGCMGGVCGAVTGAFMVLGLAHGSASAGDKPAKERTYALVREFVRRFETCNHSILCRDLLGCDISTADGMQAARERNLLTTVCPRMVQDAARILQQMLSEPETAAIA